MHAVKVLHLLTVFMWMGGLLMVSRFTALAVQETVDVQRRAHAIAKKLYWGWAVGGMVGAWLFGGILLARKLSVLDASVYGPSFHIKLALAVGLTFLTLRLRGRLKAVTDDPGTHQAAGPLMAIHGMAGLFLIGILVALYGIGSW